ncbi:MAG: proline iminopeptidase-family hydrolase [Actinobacteria bacterium]|nr:proline iminopeptidase-family hydrolase [Actinomycetota bacterium]
MENGMMTWQHGNTAYTILGDLHSGKTPLVALHGGPGFLGKSAMTVAQYAEKSGRPAVIYDQIGCGSSSLLREKPKEFWQADIFVQEFYELIKHLGIEDNFAINGHSWGGLLAAEIAITQPRGLKALVLSSPLGDSDTWVAGVKELLAQMPSEISSVIIKHEEAGTTTTDEYMEAAFKFYDKHVIRIPMPQDVIEIFDEALADQNVYNAMWGPSELMCNGTLAGHVVTDRLDRIIAPTLIISGKYDECMASTAGAYLSGIKGSRWELFEESSHLSYVEEAAKYQRVMNDFLAAKC